MSSVSDIHPSTIEGIKRLAKPIKREKRVAHSEALDLAAQSAGFQNFRHARNQLEATQPLARPRHPVLISGYWRDQAGQAGRETLRIFLSALWPAVLRAAELQSCRGLAAFRIDASDHLECRKDFPDQESARKKVCEAARALQFIDITDLRPLTRRPPLQTGSRARRLPMRDHPSFWRDPVTAEIVEVDEPYRSPDEALSARQAWAEAVGASVATTSWAGMYVPGIVHDVPFWAR